MTAMMRHVLLLLVLAAPHAAAQGILDPGGRPDPAWPGFYAWYDCAAGLNGLVSAPPDGARIDAWHDRTARGHNLVRVDADPTRRPHYHAPACSAEPGHVAFDGDDYLWGDKNSQFGTLSAARTIFVVARVRSADGGYVFDGTTSAQRNALFTGQSAAAGRWHLFSGAGNALAGPAVETDTFQVHTLVLTGAHQEHYLDGQLLHAGAATLTPLGGLILGSRYSVSLQLVGDIAEMLVYAAALTPAERQAVEGYLLAKYPPVAAPLRPTPIDVFVSGDGRYHTYRIPAIVRARSGVLLAFAEGRASRSDHAMNDIVLRRSFDGGRTWAPLQVLRDEGGDSLNNPCALQIERGLFAGRIILMYQRYPQGCHTNCVQPGYSGSNILRSYYMVSNDDGATWTWPVEITAAVKRPAPVRAVSSGPGIGIQKRHAPFAGRIVFPFNQVDLAGVWKVYAVFSDDGGINWSYGAVADDSGIGGYGNEVQILERDDGALLLNARRTGGKPFRKVALSFDGALSWTPLRDEEALISPRCMGSILAFTDPAGGFARNRVLYSGPNTARSRSMGAAHLSLDGGRTWPFSRILYRDSFAYSVLSAIDERTLGCLFERDGYARISLVRFTAEWLSGGCDCLGGGLHAQSYGAGCPGAGGFAPALDATGCPTPGGALDLALSHGPGGASAVLAFGLRRAALSVGPCSLLVEPLFATAGPLQLAGTGPGAGSAAFTLAVPPLAGLFFAFTVQAHLLDPAAPLGVTTSNGLALTIF